MAKDRLQSLNTVLSSENAEQIQEISCLKEKVQRKDELLEVADKSNSKADDAGADTNFVFPFPPTGTVLGNTHELKLLMLPVIRQNPGAVDKEVIKRWVRELRRRGMLLPKGEFVIPS